MKIRKKHTNLIDMEQKKRNKDNNTQKISLYIDTIFCKSANIIPARKIQMKKKN